MLRFLLFRFLPRRLFPILIVIEAIQLIRRWQRRDAPPIEPPPGRRATYTTDPRSSDAPRRGWMDRRG
jgi:hypothetical protein